MTLDINYLTSDPVGRHLLRTRPADTIAHAGFTYTTRADGAVIATGGDAHIVVGIYANDDELADGDPIAYREWHDTTPDSIRAAIAFARDALNNPNP